MDRRHAFLLAAAGAFVAGLLSASIAATIWLKARLDSGSGSREALVAGGAREDAIEVSRSSERLYTVEVDERAVALRLELSSRDTELVLQAARDRGGDEDRFEFSSFTDAGRAELSIDRFTDPPIAAGRFRVRVAWTSEAVPRTAERRLDRIPFRIEAHVLESRVDGVLEPGRPSAGTIDGETGGFRSFQVEVPREARALRIDLLDVANDLDLYVRRGSPILSLEEDVLFAQHFYGRETILVGGGRRPPEPGTWFVDVVDVMESEDPVSFRILATLGTEPPAEALAVPEIPEARGATPVARALSAVVEIATDDSVGSGTILSKDGWILTNSHVVERVGGGSFEEVVVSASLDPKAPPVELFRGKVESVDEDRDLALVRIVSGFYGQPLPKGYTFPTVEAGDPGLPAIGEPIWLVGYPSTGGQGSRVSITCTSGVVSGYDTAAFGTLIKTDAEITNGNSGGAALDERGRLVGVPTSLVESGSGQVAFVHPLSAMQEGWWEKMRDSAKR